MLTQAVQLQPDAVEQLRREVTARRGVVAQCLVPSLDVEVIAGY